MKLLNNIFILSIILYLNLILVTANTETFVLNLKDVNSNIASDGSILNFSNKLLNEDDTPFSIFNMTDNLINETNEYIIDMSNTDNYIIIISVGNIKRSNYFIRTCWSAIHPISIDLSTIPKELQTPEFFVVTITADFYSNDDNSVNANKIMSSIPIQITFSENNLFMDSVSSDLLKLAIYVITVALGAITISFAVI